MQQNVMYHWITYRFTFRDIKASFSIKMGLPTFRQLYVAVIEYPIYGIKEDDFVTSSLTWAQTIRVPSGVRNNKIQQALV
jgi:hypothetical protein